MEKIPSLVEGRRHNAEYFTQIMSDVPEIRIQSEVGESSWFGFSLVLEGAQAGKRSDVVAALTEHSIECRPLVAGNFTRTPVMTYLNAVVPDHLPAADKIHVDGLFVGNHHFPIFDELDLLKRSLVALR